MLPQSTSQTIGPFFSIGMSYDLHQMVTDATLGERITIRGRVIDGTGNGVDDAVIEIWQADANGIYPSPDDPNYANVDSNFVGIGRSDTTDEGDYWFKTIKPGKVGDMSPHLAVRIFMRGLLLQTVTRFFFADEDNSQDEIFNSIPEDRRDTVLMQPSTVGGETIYTLDIYMQGENETVFFTP